jgi:hypothetical protein
VRPSIVSRVLVAPAVVALVACGGHSADRAADAPPPDTARSDSTSSGDGSGSGSACPHGSTLIVARTSCSTTPVVPPASLLSSTAQPGDVVSLDGLDETSLPCLASLVCSPSNAATMLFSDDPESPSTDGVLYADTFGPGHARVYVYHVNADSNLRKFPVVVLNEGSADAHVTITQEGLGGPSSDYVDVGKAVAAAWMSSSLATVVDVPAGTRVLLDANLDAEHAATGELVHAIIDLAASAPVKISVVSVLATEDATTVTAGLLANDGLHDRGTFPGADVWLVAGAGGEGSSARRVTLGDGTTEPELTGVDATTGSAATLDGNYGVAYNFIVDASDPIRFAASARGGDWAGAVDTSATVSPLPTATGALSAGTMAVWLATLAAGPLDFVLMSGGGSSLPIDVIVMTQ